MQDWPQFELQGTRFVIPRVCPNCMAPAQNEWPTRYSKARFGGQTHYWMTFYYCDACSDLFREVKGVEKKIAKLGNSLVAAWFLVGIGWIMMLGIVFGFEMTYEGTAILVGTGIIAWLAVRVTRHFHRKREALWQADKPPLPPYALGYGFAAFLIDTQGFMGNKRSTFAAARQEWLNLLVAANSSGGQ